jgi:hypothetical protein
MNEHENFACTILFETLMMMMSLWDFCAWEAGF